MKLSPEARFKAVEAFRQELGLAIVVLRNGLSAPAPAWKGNEYKPLLHRLKGGAGFLGYTHLTIEMSEFESISLTYPSDPQKWLDCVKRWEKELNSLS